MATTPSSEVTSDFLIRGTDYLAAHPDFKLIGRQDELNAAYDVLLRKNTGNNLVLCGPGGVGLSSLVMGLQANKDEPGTPFEIGGKSFFYLDVDALFSSSDTAVINENFQKAMDTLEKSPDAVLIIEDTKGFLDGMRNTNTSNIANVLMRAVRTNPNFQAIFEASNEELSELTKAHTDITKIFAVQDINPPAKDKLRDVIENMAKNMGEEYGVTVSKEAVDSVLELTTKYPGISRVLGAAQPKVSEILLEGAITAYSRTANARPPELDGLEATLETVTKALDKGEPAEGDLADKTPDELAAIRVETEASIKEVNDGWAERQKAVRFLQSEQSKAEAKIQEINGAIADQKKKDADFKKAREEARDKYDAAATDQEKEAIKKDFKDNFGKELVVGTGAARDDFNKKYGAITGSGLAASDEVQQLVDARKPFDESLAQNKVKYAELTKSVNTGVVLTDEPVLAEFSRISKIDLNKLKQDDGEKLMRLEETIKQRVFGQDAAVKAVAKAVRRGKAGLKKPNKPVGTFLFLGPTGVGKTELAKAITEALFGDETAMHVYNMPEYSEKNAVTKMIGSPPGYEGYDEGGLLTNDMMRQPSCVNLFDEAEKAHPDMFDILLRIADEGRLSDNHGREVFFGDAINILTSNIGASYFLDDTLTFDEAKEKAMKDLYRHQDPNDMSKEVGFRPEFLKRLDGIFCFNRLDDGQIKLIAFKNLKELNGWLADKKMSVEMPDADVAKMCKDNYKPEDGARGVMHYIADTITSDVSDTVLLNPNKSGVVEVSYDTSKGISTKFVPEGAAKTEPKSAAAAPANTNNKAAKPAAA